MYIHVHVSKLQEELHPMSEGDEVWHTIGVDLIDPSPETPQGNKYIVISCFCFPIGLKQQLYYQTRIKEENLLIRLVYNCTKQP